MSDDGHNEDLEESNCECARPGLLSLTKRLLARFVLSIDGGGFRGLSCLLILAHLMQEIGLDEDVLPQPCQIFDLICGTSTGGLNAIFLGRFGLSCEEAVDVYKEVGATMFDGEANLGKISSTVNNIRLPCSRRSWRKSLLAILEARVHCSDLPKVHQTQLFMKALG